MVSFSNISSLDLSDGERIRIQCNYYKFILVKYGESLITRFETVAFFFLRTCIFSVEHIQFFLLES